MMIPENEQEGKEENKKTVYKETEDDEKQDAGESSSGSDLSRTDLINKPNRSNKPLGSGHEPGTTPGANQV